METNSGIIDGCDGGTDPRSFGGNLGSIITAQLKTAQQQGMGLSGNKMQRSN